MMPAIIIQSIVILMFVLLGILFVTGKGAALIAGYNTLPKEEKEKYDEAKLLNFIGKMMFLLAFVMVFWLISIILEIDWLLYIGVILFVAITVWMIVHVNKNKRFKNN